jgi:hypothetical protein
MITDKPTSDAIWLRCKACGDAWDDWLPVHVPIATAVAHMQTYRCPACRADWEHITIRTQPLKPPGFSDA